MAGSVFLSAKKELVALLEADARLDDVRVTYGWPGEEKLERKHIYLGRTTSEHDPGPMKIGRVDRNEVCTIDVVVQVKQAGVGSEDTDMTAHEIGAVVEEIVADNRQIGNDPDNGVYVTASTMRGLEARTAYADAGAVTQLVYTVRIDARLT